MVSWVKVSLFISMYPAQALPCSVGQDIHFELHGSSSVVSGLLYSGTALQCREVLEFQVGVLLEFTND
jgi:hypothetical protein